METGPGWPTAPIQDPPPHNPVNRIPPDRPSYPYLLDLHRLTAPNQPTRPSKRTAEAHEALVGLMTLLALSAASATTSPLLAALVVATACKTMMNGIKIQAKRNGKVKC